MKYFLDTEFHEYDLNLIGKNAPNGTIELISIGIVSEDGRNFYAVSKDFDVEKALRNDWLKKNVLFPILQDLSEKQMKEPIDSLSNNLKESGFLAKLLLGLFASTENEIRDRVLEFIGDDKEPEFYAYYADYDWVVFCWLFGRMKDLPEHFPRYCRDLKQILDDILDKNVITIDVLEVQKNYPKQLNEHNALADAKWNKSLYEFLASLDE